MSAVKVVWVADENKHACRRERVDPYAREGHKEVSLAWLKKHATNVSYRVRWWVGPNGHVGEWHEHVFTDPKTDAERDATPRRGVTHLPRAVQLKDLRTYAAMVAATETDWEVEVTMLARTHENTGGDYNNVVWTFGHAARNTTEAKRIRGESI
jgi:hypothetical protein